MAGTDVYSWSSMPPMCEPRVYSTVVVCGGHLYVVGGCNSSGQPVHTLESYNPATNEWTSLKHMPTKRAAPIAAAVNNKIVAIGGIGMDQKPVDSVEFYSIEENKWKRMQPLSEALMGMALVMRDNKIHIFGGMASDTNPRDHYKCLEVPGDTSGGVKGNWQAFTPMPTARYSAHAFLKNNKAFVIGGRQGKLPVASFEAYDYDSRSWTVYPELLTKRIFPCHVMTDKYMLSLGGLKQTVQQGFSEACEIYDVEQQEKGEWVSMKKRNMPTKRGDFGAVCLDNKVIVVGGLGNQGAPLSSVEMFDPDTKKWKRLADMPKAHTTCSCTTSQGNLYVIGGVSPDGPTAECEVYRRNQ